MKKMFLFALTTVMMSFVGCQMNEQDAPVNPSAGESTFELVADILHTRTTLDPNSYEVEWEAGDIIYMVTSDGTWGKPYSDDKNANTIAEFTYADGKFTTDATIAEGEYTFKGMYAVASQKSYHRGTSSIHKLEAIQNQNCTDPTAHIKANDALVGTFTATVPMNETAQMSMSHLYTLMQVNVKNTTGAAIEVTKFEMTAAGADLAAIFNVTAFDTPALTTKQGASSTITVNIIGGSVANNASLPVYFVMAPLSNYAGDVTFKVTDSEDKTYTKTVAMNGISFEAGKYNTTPYTIKDADVVDPQPEGVVTATISFANTTQRTEYTTTNQVWENEGVVFTNSKGSSTSNIGDYSNPARFYKSSDITITAPGNITKLEFNCDGLESKYVTPLTELAAPDGTSSIVTYKSLSAQARAYSLTVTYSTTGETPEQPENPEPEAVTLSSIAVSEPQIEYTVGDGFVKPTVTATYSDNSTKEVTAEFSGYDMNTAGTYTVNVSYTEKEVTATDSYEIVVKVKEATEIVAHTVTWNLSEDETSEASTSKIAWEADGVSMANSKGTAQTNANNYYPGVDNRTSTRFYSGNSLVISPKSGYAINSIVFTATTEGYANALKGSTWTNASATVSGSTVTVNPEDGREEISASITGTCGFTKVVVELVPSEGYVKPVVVLTSIALSGQTTDYTVGDTFAFTGTVTATYSNGSTKTVTPTTVSSPDMASAGSKEVTVTYTEEGVSVSSKYTITVSEKATEPEEPGQPSTTPKYVKVTSNQADWSGTYLIVWSDNKARSKVNSKDLASVSNSALSISDNEISVSANTEKDEVVISSNSNGYTIKLSDGQYLYVTNANQVNAGVASKATTMSLNWTSSGVEITGVDSANNTRYLYQNGTYYRMYKKNTSYKLPNLYKLVN